jgi:hypothetical protein
MNKKINKHIAKTGDKGMAIHATVSYMNCLSRLDGKEIGSHI